MYPYLNIHPFDERLLQAFSWMLVHSLWQGVLLAIMTAILLQLTKRAGSVLRYNIIFVHFLLFIVTCAVTFIRELDGSPSQAIVPLAQTIGYNASGLLNLHAVDVKLFATTCAAYVSTHAQLLVLLWALFFAFRSFRMAQGLLYLQRAKHKKIHAAPAEWHNRFTLLCRKLQITKSIRLLESGYVKVPLVIGHLKPVILIPAGLLTGMPAEQIEAVLLHELAHIRRHDYIVNLLQTLSETVFFFNPGLLWISALLRDEREHCCDDIALNQTGNKREFIQALISFKEYTLSDHYAAVAFPGKKNQLLQRVSRIITNKHQSLGTGEKVFFMAGIIMLSAVLSAAAITQLRNLEHQTDSKPVVIVKSEVVAPVSPQVPAVQADKIKRAKPAARTRRPSSSRTISSQPFQSSTTSTTIPGRTEISTEEKSVSTSYFADSKQQTHFLTPAQKEAQTATFQQREQSRRDKEQAERDRTQAKLDRLQADRDREQADRDREQAHRDKLQAEKDRMQAQLDRIQADKDRAQADRDREQSIRDRVQAEKDRAQGEREQSARERERKEYAEKYHRYVARYSSTQTTSTIQ